MSLQYLLDGYNIIKKVPHLAQLKLEDGREALVTLIEKTKPQGSMRNSVTVVFDGQPGIVGGHRRSSVSIIFTAGETADEKIKRIVTRARNKRQIVVVTDDRDITFAVRAQGAEVMKVSSFVGKVFTGGDSRLKRAPGSVENEKNISKAVECKITDEFKNIWLRKKGE